MTPSRIENINSEWYWSAPFLSEFLLRFKYVEDKNCPTFGVGFSKSFILYYNQDFMDTLTDAELKGVLVHEIMHIIYIHTVRFEKVIKNNVNLDSPISEYMRVYNYAADTVINERIMTDLTINGNLMKLPKDCWSLKHPLLKDYKGPLVTEQVYMYLLDTLPKQNYSVSSGGIGNTSSGQDKNDGSDGNPIKVSSFDEHGRLGELDEQEAKELAELIKHTAHVKGWGKMGGDMVGHIKELLAPKKIPLQEILRKMLQMMADGYLVKYDTYTRINRRNQSMLPGKKKKGTVLNLIVDTSGSCFSEQDQKLFFSEIDYISNKVRDINLIQFDTEVTSATKYKKGGWRKLKLKGSGGTDVQPVFDYLKEKKLNNFPTIVFTDGYFNWNLKHFNVEPLWVVNNKSCNPTFGHLFILDGDYDD